MNKGDELRAIRNKVIADTHKRVGEITSRIIEMLTTQAYQGLNSVTINCKEPISHIMNDTSFPPITLTLFFEEIKQQLEAVGLCARHDTLRNIYSIHFPFESK